MDDSKSRFGPALFAVSVLLVMVIYGLMIRPMVQDLPAMPLEVVFLSAGVIVITQLLYLGFGWTQIQQAIADKLTQAIPTILLLFAIGLLIGSWIIAGTIPMLVNYALTIVSAEHIYFIAFVVPIFFSVCTGTSWGSIATIGLVLITVAQVIQADLAIVTGAIVGGAYFGDKMSPLSDTTNIAAMVVNVPLYQHIQAMMYTTGPSALLAAVVFFILDGVYPAQSAATGKVDTLAQTLDAIALLFDFHWLLLLPPLIVVFGSVKRYPPLAVLIVSSLVACLLALAIQSYDLTDVIQAVYKGFSVDMASKVQTSDLPQHIAVLFNRGGLYALSEPIMITILVFIYVGAIDCINAMGTIINRLLGGITRRSSLIWAALVASGVTNAITSSQYANSFIVGQAFADKFDALDIKRQVLSRSLEDTGTMIESIVPWSTTAVFVYASLGVSVQDYWHWQLLSLFNIPLAFVLAWWGVGCYQQTQIQHNLRSAVSGKRSG